MTQIMTREPVNYNHNVFSFVNPANHFVLLQPYVYIQVFFRIISKFLIIKVTSVKLEDEHHYYKRNNY